MTEASRQPDRPAPPPIPAAVVEGARRGGIVQGEGYMPSAEGSMVYLNGGEDLDVPLGKVEGAGGKILVPKTDIGENGFFAYFVDTEGNKVGLHSMG